MEALLSLSFDNISSKDATKIRKGLRQIEGLLAQICLSPSKSASSLSPGKRRMSAASAAQQSQLPKQLDALAEDPAFRELFRLQEGFEWNVATRLVACLERLLGMGSSGQADLLILSALDLLQGILLLHPPSRTLFCREIYMNLLLDLLDDPSCPAIQSTTLLVLVTALLDNPANTRMFETADGLFTISSLFKSPSATHSFKLQIIEFLYFYLMPETPGAPANGTQSGPQRSPSRLLNAFERRRGEGEGGGGGDAAQTRTTEEKTRLLGRYLSNVEELVEDLRENAPFGEIAC